MPAAAGFGILLAIVSVTVQIAVVVYFFILFHRLIGTVERIERQTAAIEQQTVNIESTLKTTGG